MAGPERISTGEPASTRLTEFLFLHLPAFLRAIAGCYGYLGRSLGESDDALKPLLAALAVCEGPRHSPQQPPALGCSGIKPDPVPGPAAPAHGHRPACQAQIVSQALDAQSHPQPTNVMDGPLSPCVGSPVGRTPHEHG